MFVDLTAANDILYGPRPYLQNYLRMVNIYTIATAPSLLVLVQKKDDET